MAIKVVIAGAKGKMGSEAVKMVLAEPEFELVCGVSSSISGEDVGDVIGIGKLGVPFYNKLEDVLERHDLDVLVDFTTPDNVKRHMELAIQNGVRPVVGTTGMSPADIAGLEQLCRDYEVGSIIAPNFAIGAVLMMKFAREAAKYMPDVEIIELHHDRKLDAPSGTALKTAEMIAEVREEHRQGHPDEKEIIDGSRGGFYEGFPIHSVRLQGLVAHQQVLFGSEGQTLKLQHDTINRTSFMPGVNLAIKKVMNMKHLIYGLDQVMDEE